MKTQLYVIFDKAAKVYNKPFHQLNDQVAMRTAIDLVTDGDTEIRKHPEDFTMFRIGSYDDEKATFELHEQERICNFHEIQIPEVDVTTPMRAISK